MIIHFSKKFFIPDFLRQIKFVAPHVVSIVEERIFDMTGVKIITRICESSPVYKFHKWSTFWTNDLGNNCLFFFLYLLSLIVALILIVAGTACWAELVTVTTWNYGEIWRTMKNLTPKIERIYWLVSVAQLRLFSFNMPINEVPSAEMECLKTSALSKSIADTSSCFQAFL